MVVGKADVAKKQEAQLEEWKKRGVQGTISELNADSKDMVVSTRSREGVKPLIVPVGGKVDIRRYAPGSIVFADAKPAAVADLKVGDQVWVLGTKSDDGTHLTPEVVVAGTFKNIAATVLSVDAAAKTIKVTDLDTKKPELVKIEGDTKLKKLPPETATMLAARVKNTTAAGGGGPRPQGARRAAGGHKAAGRVVLAAAAVEGAISRRYSSARLRSALADLKAGDALIILIAAGTEPDKVTAVTLLAGVEPILTSAPKGRQGMVLGNWNLGGGGAEQ